MRGHRRDPRIERREKSDLPCAGAGAALFAVAVPAGDYSARERGDEQAKGHYEGDLAKSRRPRGDRGSARGYAEYGKKRECENGAKHKTNVD